jgi:voltage-gated potassium channel
MRILRVLRLLRLLKLSRYADSVQLLALVLRENGRNFVTALGVLMIMMILTASGIYLIERDVQPEAFGSIPAAMWWAFATLTTVGYGDVTPITPLGKLFGAGITIVSIGIVALPAGLLASSFSARLRQSSEAYRDAADEALADGIVTPDELAELEKQREALGLGADLAASILAEEQTRRTRMTCPTCGQRLDGGPERGPS